jgi:hypothetical protein
MDTILKRVDGKTSLIKQLKRVILIKRTNIITYTYYILVYYNIIDIHMVSFITLL